MKVLDWDRLKPGGLKNTALTIGAFDGVHLGHREIFRQLVEVSKKRSLVPVAITFQPLPREVFGKKQGAIAILSFEERKRRIELCGIEKLVVVRFSREYAKVSALDFMEQVRKKLDPRMLVIGHDFRLGKGKSAGESWLRRYCEKNGIELKVVRAVRAEGAVVSSSRIRELLKEGELEKVSRIMALPYQLEGKVVSGHHRGKALGFATANLAWEKELLVPTGIYIGWAYFNHKKFPAAINIGYNPTFGDTDLRIEAHLIGFSGRLYGKKLTLSLLKRLRGEIKFKSIDALREQIQKDVEETRRFLGVK